MKNYIYIFLAVLILGVGGYLFLGGRNVDNFTKEESMGEVAQEQIMEETQASESAEAVETYTLEDIAFHNSTNDCWFAIEGKVYDVSDFISSQKHPGKEAILEGCGLDATDFYNTRPMGSGTPHSDKAREGLENYYIGELVQE